MTEEEACAQIMFDIENTKPFDPNANKKFRVIGGQSKSLEEVWKENIIELSINIEKDIKIDSGGTDGSVPQSYIDDALKIIQMVRSGLKDGISDADLAKKIGANQYVKDNKRATNIRKSVQKRTIAIRTMAKKQSFQAYLRRLKKCHKKHVDIYSANANKRNDRVQLLLDSERDVVDIVGWQQEGINRYGW